MIGMMARNENFTCKMETSSREEDSPCTADRSSGDEKQVRAPAALVAGRDWLCLATVKPAMGVKFYVSSQTNQVLHVKRIFKFETLTVAHFFIVFIDV